MTAMTAMMVTGLALAFYYLTLATAMWAVRKGA